MSRFHDEIVEEDKGAKECEEIVPLIHLGTKGRLLEMAPSFKDLKSRHGEICAIQNFEMRGKQWKFTCSCSSPISGEFAVADDRGEVYLVSVEANSYKLIRSASTPVAAMAFISCRRNQLLISYESGQVVLVDTESRDVLANIQTERSGLPPVRFVKCHPSKPMVVLASDDACVSVWDLRTMKCKNTLECDEAILSAEFELGGHALILALQKTGVYVYRTEDLQVLRHCSLPHSERGPDHWTAYNCHVLLPAREKKKRGGRSKDKASFAGDPHLRVSLAGDNGSLYVWNVIVPLSVIKRSAAAAAAATGDKDGDSDDDKSEGRDEDTDVTNIVHESKLLAVLSLPVDLSTVVEMSTLPPAHYSAQGGNATAPPKQIGDRQTRILAISEAGQVAVLDVREATFTTIGEWTVVISMEAEQCLGAPTVWSEEEDKYVATPLTLSTHLIAVNSAPEAKNGDMMRESQEFKSYVRSHASLHKDMDLTGAGQLFYLSQKMHNHKATKPGLVTGTADSIVCTGSVDGAARIYDLDACLGTGQLAGYSLRHREPYHLSRRHELRRHIHDKHLFMPTSAPADNIGASGSTGGALSEAQAKAKQRLAARSSGRGKGESRGSGSSSGSFEESVSSRSAPAPTPAPAVAVAAGRDGVEEEEDGAAIATSIAAAANVAVGGVAPATQSQREAEKGGGLGLDISSLKALEAPHAQGHFVASSSGRSGSSLTDASEYAEYDGAATTRFTSNHNTIRDYEADDRELYNEETSGEGVAARGPVDLETKRAEKLERDRAAAAKKRVKAEERARVMREKQEAAEKRRLAKLEKKRAAEEEGISNRALEMFELSSLSKQEVVDNRIALQDFRDGQGQYPTRYRPLIWRFLLQLPEHIDACDGLLKQEVHYVYSDLRERYPLPDDALFTRLQRLCSSLAHWDPMFSEAGVVQFLPQLCFPFVVLFGSDEMAALETVVSIFMYWGFSWFVTYPAQPTHIYTAIDKLVAKHDRRLHYHLEVLEISAGELAYGILRTLFTETLNAPDWLKLMDFLITYFLEDGHLLLACVAILRALKPTILPLDNSKNVFSVVRQQHFFDVDALIDDILYMKDVTAEEEMNVLTTTTVSGDDAQLSGSSKVGREGGRRPEDDEDDDDEDQWAAIAKSFVDKDENAEAVAGKPKPVHPLPKSGSHNASIGTYPAYNNYARHLLDLNMKTRQQSDALEKEIKRRNAVLNKLRKQADELEANHSNWMLRNSARSDVELKNRVKAMQKEKLHMMEVMRLEEEISRQRVELLSKVERAARAELGVIESSTNEASKFIEDSEKHLNEKMNVALKIQKHRELAENTHLATEERLRKLQTRRSREDFIKGITQQIQGQEQELEAKNALLSEEWLREDEDLARRRADRVARAKQAAEAESMARLHDEMTHRMQRLLLAREAKIIEIERSRQMRRARDETDEALEAAERAALASQKADMATALDKAADLAARGHGEIASKLEETITKIRRESSRLIATERKNATKQKEARTAAQDAMLRKEWADHQEKLLKGAVVAEGDLQEQYTRLRRSAIELEIEEIRALKSAETSIFNESDLKAAAPTFAESPGVVGVPASRTQGTPTRSGAGDVELRTEDLYKQYEEASAVHHPELVVDSVRTEDLYHKYEARRASLVRAEAGTRTTTTGAGPGEEEDLGLRTEDMYAEFAEHSGIERVEHELDHENLEYRQMRDKLLQQQRIESGEVYHDSVERYRAEQLSHTQRLDPRLGPLGSKKQPTGIRRISTLHHQEKLATSKEKAGELSAHISSSLDLDTDGPAIANPSVSLRQFPGTTVQTQRRSGSVLVPPGSVSSSSAYSVSASASASSSGGASGSSGRSGRSGSLDALEEEGDDDEASEPALWQA